jgi:hypothetical protein
MRLKTLCMYVIWAVCGLCFYGLAQYMGQIGGNIFINVAISGQFSSSRAGFKGGGGHRGGPPGASTKQKYKPKILLRHLLL